MQAGLELFRLQPFYLNNSLTSTEGRRELALQTLRQNVLKPCHDPGPYGVNVLGKFV